MESGMTRRDFLQGATAALGVTASISRTALAAPAADGMFVSLNGALTAGKNVGWPELARLAAHVGYGGVDWSIGPAQSEGLERTRALFTELGIKPTVTNLPMARPLPFGGEDAAFRDALGKLADDAAFSAAVGCHRMMVVLPPAGPQQRNEYRKVVRDRIAALSDVLKKSNTRLGLNVRRKCR
jgi:hypothetical protein